MESAVVAALISAPLAAVVAVITTVLAGRQQGQLQVDRFERELRNRMQTDLRTEFMAEQAIRHLLLMEGWQLRSFDAIRHRVGGFDDESLRQLLVRSGALRFRRSGDGAEMWGLRERNQSSLADAG